MSKTIKMPLPSDVRDRAASLLSELAALDLAQYRAEAVTSCLCGCGESCKKAFARGHDRKFEGQALEKVFGGLALFAAVLAPAKASKASLSKTTPKASPSKKRTASKKPGRKSVKVKRTR